MIYILEGTHGGGKTTFTQKLIEQGYTIKKRSHKSLAKIKAEIEADGDNNIVYDRLCLQFWKKRPDSEFVELNAYLQSLGDKVKCVKFIGDIDRAVEKMTEHNMRLHITQTEEEIRADMEAEKAYYERVFALMPVFVEQ